MDGVTKSPCQRHLCVVNLSRNFILFCLVFLPMIALSSGIEGVVLNTANEPLAYAQIGVAEKNTSTQTNAKGEFRLDLKPGIAVIQVYLMGYLPFQDTVIIPNGKMLHYKVVLKESAAELSTVEVVANGRDLAKEVMSKAIEKHDFFLKKEKGTPVILHTKKLSKNNGWRKILCLKTPLNGI